jgi:tetratricopeptide (TPR) repeat protein
MTTLLILRSHRNYLKKNGIIMTKAKNIIVFIGLLSSLILFQGCQTGGHGQYSHHYSGKQYINEENSDYLAWLNKSDESLQEGMWAEAIRTASVAVRLKPGMPDGYINRAWAYNEKKMYDLGIADCNKALEISPGNVAAINNRGVAYLAKDETKKAYKDFREACENGLDVACKNFEEIAGYLPSEESDILTKQIDEKVLAGDNNEVIALTSRIIELEPNNVTALSTRCRAQANLDMFAKAKKDCLKAININPDYAETYANLGFILEQQGKVNEAAIYYEMSCGLGNAASCDNLKE